HCFPSTLAMSFQPHRGLDMFHTVLQGRSRAHQGRYKIRETKDERSARREGESLKRSPVIAINLPALYTSTPRPVFRPGCSDTRPKICNPLPDCETSMNVAGQSSRIC